MERLDQRLARLVGARPVTWQRRFAVWQPTEPVEGANDRFSVTLDGGRRVFVKTADAPHTADWVRREAEVYQNLGGSFIARFIGFDDDPEQPILVIEDLSEADWEVHWDSDRVAAVRAALVELARSSPPPNTRPMREAFPELFGGWSEVERDPGPFLATRIRPESWLDHALPLLAEAAETATVDGEDLLHLDVRSDNLCFRDGRAVLVDWNWCCLGNAAFDVAAWLPSLALEDGPPPWEVLPDGGPYAAFLAGVWAPRVGLPPPATAPTVRAMQRRQLEVALSWCERELGIPTHEPPPVASQRR